jgi:hypothetical protein
MAQTATNFIRRAYQVSFTFGNHKNVVGFHLRLAEPWPSLGLVRWSFHSKMADRFIERTILDELLRRLPKLGYPIPISIENSERPDFILTVPNGQIGIEVTRATHQEQIRMQKLKRTQLSDCWVSVQPQPDGSPRRSDEELRNAMQPLNSEWKDAETDFREWGEKVTASLASKRDRLNQSGFQIFDRNWLLLFNEPGLSRTDTDFNCATEFLRGVFTMSSTNQRDFDRVFVLSDHFLFICAQGSVSGHYDEAGTRFSFRN